MLKDKYENAPAQEQVVNIHLFGIECAEIIKKNNS
ncbi:HTH-like domain-containing protein [Chryseobacterium tructae]